MHRRKKPHIVAITEAKPKNYSGELLASEFQLDGYNVFYNGGKDNSSRGILVYASAKISAAYMEESIEHPTRCTVQCGQPIPGAGTSQLATRWTHITAIFQWRVDCVSEALHDEWCMCIWWVTLITKSDQIGDTCYQNQDHFIRYNLKTVSER